MKRLIRNILNEEIRLSEQDNINSQEEYDAYVDKARAEREAYRTGPEFDKRVRSMLNQMKNIPGLDSWSEMVKEHGVGNNFYNKDSFVTAKSVYRLMSLFGGELPKNYARNVGTNPFTYLMVETFMNNGGYGRDFRVGDLNLSPITIYDVSALVEQKMVETRHSYGTIIGAKSKEEAIRMYVSNPGAWEEDSEHHDTDYGDIINSYNGEIDTELTIEITPEMVGL